MRFYMKEVPYFISTAHDEDGGIVFEGYIGQYWELVIKGLKLNVTKIINDGYGFQLGEMYSPTNGSGCLGSLLRNESDTCMMGTSLIPEAIGWIGISQVSEESAVKMLSARPIFEITDTLPIFTCFHPNIWIAYFTVLLISYPIWSLCLKHFARSRSRKFVYNIIDVLWNGLSVTLGQSISVNPQWIGERLGWLAFIVGSFWILAAFSETWLSKLTMPSAFQYYEDLRDLIRYSNCKIYVNDNGNEKQMTKDPNDELMSKALKYNKLFFLDANDIWDVYEKLREPKSVFLGNEDYHLMFFSLCDVINKDKPFYSPETVIKHERYYLVFNRHLPERLKEGLKRMVEIFFHSKIAIRKFERDVGRIKDMNKQYLAKNEQHSLNLKGLAFSFFLILILYTVGFVLTVIQQFH